MKFAASIVRSLTIVSLSTALAACGGGGDDDSPRQARLSCDDSIKTSFRPDAQTTVLLVKSFKKGDAFLSSSAIPTNPTTAQADLCLVKLLVGPGNPGPASAPSTSSGIGIEVWLPTAANWNGRLHATGNGGWSGSGEASLTQNSGVGLASDTRDAPWIAGTEGAVTTSSNNGHSAFGNGAFAMNPDGTINTALLTDFSSRSLHEQAVKGKALAAAYYGSAPKKSYFEGSSGGGRQALKLAQEFPEDYDGIIVSNPAINWTKFTTAEMYPQIVIQRDLSGNYMTPAQLDLVTKAAINSCDVVGGQHLGYIMDPTTCRYDPTTDTAVLCAANGGTNTTDACVTLIQANAINKIWYGMTSDGSVPSPADDVGLGISPTGKQRWFGSLRGSSLAFTASPTPFSIGSDILALILQDPKIGEPNFINATGNGQSGWKNLSYSDLSAAFDKGIELNASSFAQINSDDPDLSAFKARGGRMIHVQGRADGVVPGNGSINYYERVTARMGGLGAVQDFYKMYLVPGMDHPPLSPEGQMYELITAWVEQGIAPDSVPLKNPGPTKMSPLICPYPKKPTYQSGELNAAGSYTCS